MIRTIIVILLAGWSLSASMVAANELPFIPPNDTVGKVWTTNLNDAYSSGRGVVFSMQQDTTINSIGIFQDLTGLTLNFDVAQVTSTTGPVTLGQTVLRSGSSLITTNGLQWIDFPIAPLTLLQGNNYQIEFSFAGNSNQNFFYNNNNVQFTTGNFTLLDGTQGGDASNFVMPAERVNVVPEPAPLVLLATGFCATIVFRQRKSKRRIAASPQRNR